MGLFSKIKDMFKHVEDEEVIEQVEEQEIIEEQPIIETDEVKVDGTIWTAKASKKIKVDEKVKVLDIEGVKLIVERDDD